MNNLVAFVTGGASGLGRATVRHLLQQSTVRGCYVLDMQKVAADDRHTNLASVQGDVSKPEDVERALDDCVQKFGHLNAAVNCAGVAIAFKIFNFNNNTPHDLTEFKKLLEVGRVGPFLDPIAIMPVNNPINQSIVADQCVGHVQCQSIGFEAHWPK